MLMGLLPHWSHESGQVALVCAFLIVTLYGDWRRKVQYEKDCADRAHYALALEEHVDGLCNTIDAFVEAVTDLKREEAASQDEDEDEAEVLKILRG